MKPKKFSYYDKNGKWFSSSNGLDIDSHKKRFGDDVTFSVDELKGKFKTEAEYKKALKDNQVVFSTKTEEEKEKESADAKVRVKEKRKNRIKTFEDFKS